VVDRSTNSRNNNSNTLSAAWVLSHQFLQLHMKDSALPSRYEAIVLIGFVHASGEYVAHWIDTFGGKFSAVGKGRRTGNSVEFRFEYPDGPFFNTLPGALMPAFGRCV